MDKIRFEHIVTHYLTGKATSEEEAELLRAIRSSDEWEAAFRKRTAGWNPLKEGTADPEIDRKWERIASVITPVTLSATRSNPRRTLWGSIAAAIILLLVSGITVYFLNQSGTGGLQDTAWQTVLAEGEDCTLRLPDGSSVYLREGSELSYPDVFASQSRDVKIKGEAFFDVTHNPEQPFVVDAFGLSVTVLGTSFSVQTAADGNDISVILVEGKVSLADASLKELVRLHPDQKADYSVKDGHFTVSEVDSKRLTSWSKGILSYDNASLDEVVRLIEQTYKVTLSYDREGKENQRFSGAFLRSQKLETVLQQTNKLTGTNLILIE